MLGDCSTAEPLPQNSVFKLKQPGLHHLSHYILLCTTLKPSFYVKDTTSVHGVDEHRDDPGCSVKC